LHGQHEHQSLLKTERQLDLLDGFGGSGAAADEIAEQVARLRALDREIAAFESDDRERARRFEFLRFEVSDIDAAGLHPGEDEEIKLRLNLINNAETIFSLAQLAYTSLYENEVGAAIDAIDTASRQLDELSGIDPGFQPLAAQLAEARAMVESVAMEARSQAERREFDPRELDELNRRQAQIAALKRKYGTGIPEILAYRDKAAAEVEAYERRDERLDALRKEQERVATEALRRATELSVKRKAAARRLDKQVAAVLQDLGMKGARFETVFETADLGAHGIDRVEFLLAANLGEKAKPLRQVASGGEISRIMLALKTVFAEADKIPSLVFDEIDAGVGGAVARNVAEKLAELARSHQIICITHIAQIAAAAAGHFTVHKHTHKARTVTSLTPVFEEARVREVARLLDGSVSEVSLEHARTLLGAAR
jgi:DNA repair protein RecN (Recombination protein N)